MAYKTVEEIINEYATIPVEKRVLPNADVVDNLTRHYINELIWRACLNLGLTDDPTEQAQTIDELKEEILAIIVANQVYDQSGFYIGQPEASRLLFPIRVVTPFLLPANCAGSIAFVGVAPFTTATFSIKKNGFQIGTFTFPAGVSSATFASVETTFVAGDELQVYAPAVKDDDLEDPRWTFKINYIKEV